MNPTSKKTGIAIMNPSDSKKQAGHASQPKKRIMHFSQGLSAAGCLQHLAEHGSQSHYDGHCAESTSPYRFGYLPLMSVNGSSGCHAHRDGSD